MNDLAPWSRFLAQQIQQGPMIFTGGLRHAVKKDEDCCFHSHDEIEIVYHPTGAGITRLQSGEELKFAVKGVVIYAPGEMHDQAMEVDGEDLCVRVTLPKKSRLMPRGFFGVADVHDAAIVRDIQALSLKSGRSDPVEDAIQNLRVTSVLFALIQLAHLRQQEKVEPVSTRYVAQAERYIQEHFREIETLDEVARHVGISLHYLRHIYKKQRMSSLIHFLNEVRVDQARMLLVHSGLPLKQVAAACGFEDEFYFSKVFRQFAGTPPGRYRASNASRVAARG